MPSARQPSLMAPRPSSESKERNKHVNEFELFEFAEALQREQPPAEPWFLEMTRLRRLHFLHINTKLAGLKKRVLESEKVLEEDMIAIGKVLGEQANAIRDFQLIHSLDFLSPEQKEKRMKASVESFPGLVSAYPTIFPFETENYRCLPRARRDTADQVREFIRTWGPRKFTWTKEEIDAKWDLYEGKKAPQTLSASADRLARFLVAMVGALFILVPIYIMSIHQNQTKNLVTTTVAVVLFAVVCSISLRTTNDQTLASTAAYSAVLVVFVGLTS